MTGMSQEPEEKHVVLDTVGAVAWVRLNRPEKLNPIGTLARRQLDAALKQVERDEAVRCVVLIGSGRAFSAGADVEEMAAAGGGQMRSPEDVGRVLREEYLVMLQRLRTMPKPVICGMNGLAAGIGASFDARLRHPDRGRGRLFFGGLLEPRSGARRRGQLDAAALCRTGQGAGDVLHRGAALRCRGRALRSGQPGRPQGRSRG